MKEWKQLSQMTIRYKGSMLPKKIVDSNFPIQNFASTHFLNLTDFTDEC